MNIPRKDRRLVRDAATRLIIERGRFDQQTVYLRERFDRYRPAILLGGGLALGLLLGRKNFVQATRSALSIAGLGFGLMRSSLGSMLVAATLRKTPRSNAKPVRVVQKAQG